MIPDLRHFCHFLALKGSACNGAVLFHRLQHVPKMLRYLLTKEQSASSKWLNHSGVLCKRVDLLAQSARVFKPSGWGKAKLRPPWHRCLVDIRVCVLDEAEQRKKHCFILTVPTVGSR